MNILVSLLFYWLVCHDVISGNKPDDSSKKCSLDTRWKDFRAGHKKPSKDFQEDSKEDSEEDEFRCAQWKSADDIIANHKSDSFQLKHNDLSDLTKEEYVALNGARIEKTSHRVKRQTTYSSSVRVSKLPSSVNWTAKGWVNPVKKQGQCGSCWAFAGCAALEAYYYKKFQVNVDLSEQQLVECTLDLNFGCRGGYSVKTYEYIKANGITTEEEYPYKCQSGCPTYQNCSYNVSTSVTSLSNYQYIAWNSESDLQRAVALVGPVIVTIDASTSLFQLYSNGVYKNPNCSSDISRLNHAVLVVGYGTSNNTPYWLIKNSWGTTWGMQGYMMMARNSNNMCGIATYALFPNI